VLLQAGACRAGQRTRGRAAKSARRLTRARGARRAQKTSALSAISNALKRGPERRRLTAEREGHAESAKSTPRQKTSARDLRPCSTAERIQLRCRSSGQRSGELKRRLVVSGLLWYSDAPRRKKSPSSASQFRPAPSATFAVFKQPRNIFMHKEFCQMAQGHRHPSRVGAWQRPCDKPKHTFQILGGGLCEVGSSGFDGIGGSIRRSDLAGGDTRFPGARCSS